MDEQRIEAAATFWVVERFEDGNGRSLGYWTGHNSRDFTPNIIDAMQFVRRDDALLAKSPWHWRDCEATEHKFIGVRAASPHLAQDEGLRNAAQALIDGAHDPMGGKCLVWIGNVNTLKAALAAPLPESVHDYLSTACYHSRHAQCRKQCKFCSVACKCECHNAQPPAPAPDEGVVVKRMQIAAHKVADSLGVGHLKFESTEWGKRIMTAALRVANEARDAEWAAWGIIEVAVRNPSVAEYMKHWEERALKAEEELARRSRLTQPRSAEERARDEEGVIWLAITEFCSVEQVQLISGKVMKVRCERARLDREGK